MIAFVEGRVDALAPDSAVVEVGGIGLDVRCTPSTLARLRVGEQARVPTSLVVREDSLTLYGFADTDERTVFELLQTASGVGPRLARAMLAVHTPDVLRRAVATEDTTTLTKVPGVGRKGAQRIVLELKDRLGPAPEDVSPAGGPGVPGGAPMAAPWRDQVHSALVNLGWSAKEAEQATTAAAAEADEVVSAGGEPDVSALLRSALRKLSRS